MKKAMKLDQCMTCAYFIETRADCVLCKYGDELQHRVVDKETVVGCPKNK